MNMKFPNPPRRSAILLAVILLAGVALTLGLRKTITLSIDGQSRRLTTYAFTVGNLLHALDVPLSPLDDLSPPTDAWLKNGDQITLLHAIPIQILADGEISSIFSAERVPSRLLSQADGCLPPGDLILSNGQP